MYSLVHSLHYWRLLYIKTKLIKFVGSVAKPLLFFKILEAQVASIRRLLSQQMVLSRLFRYVMSSSDLKQFLRKYPNQPALAFVSYYQSKVL